MIEADRPLAPKWEGAEETKNVGGSCTDEQASLKTRRQVWVSKCDRTQANSEREVQKSKQGKSFHYFFSDEAYSLYHTRTH
ncbi:hypothetical protein H6G64_32870 [Calothrix sp. FACHB-156]|nr:hypothetical protein [Calothrix sp. FACHB-156]